MTWKQCGLHDWIWVIEKSLWHHWKNIFEELENTQLSIAINQKGWSRSGVMSFPQRCKRKNWFTRISGPKINSTRWLTWCLEERHGWLLNFYLRWPNMVMTPTETESTEELVGGRGGEFSHEWIAFELFVGYLTGDMKVWLWEKVRSGPLKYKIISMSICHIRVLTKDRVCQGVWQWVTCIRFICRVE